MARCASPVAWIPPRMPPRPGFVARSSNRPSHNQHARPVHLATRSPHQREGRDGDRRSTYLRSPLFDLRYPHVHVPDKGLADRLGAKVHFLEPRVQRLVLHLAYLLAPHRHQHHLPPRPEFEGHGLALLHRAAHPVEQQLLERRDHVGRHAADPRQGLGHLSRADAHRECEDYCLRTSALDNLLGDALAPALRRRFFQHLLRSFRWQPQGCGHAKVRAADNSDEVRSAGERTTHHSILRRRS
mmetsp:Transcript_96620/g.275767  ORF Transcript_96620/g.275767 Transcript_96620/m.275767 type:complete len:242 (+) Transcript_96620:286-1011(+)